MDHILELIGREEKLFKEDLDHYSQEIEAIISGASFLILGGAGSIGQAVVKEIFKRGPRTLHVVDISENNMVELVRDIRSSLGYTKGDFRSFALDVGSLEFDALVKHQGPYDYVLNLSALKHVRSEKDPYTLMRMINVNILNTEKTLIQAERMGAKKYFCVSTDKAANPVNMMGASKRIMELFLMRRSLEMPVSTARFANVAFSDGSLLHGFNQRMQKRQPLSAPNDIRRYFVTPGESGELCLLSCLLGENRDVFFPKLSEKLHLITFEMIARRYLAGLGLKAFPCETEEIARKSVEKLSKEGKWPCYFFESTTTGEKDFEEFFTEDEALDLEKFKSIGVIKRTADFHHELLDGFTNEIQSLQNRGRWSNGDLVSLFNKMLPEFNHKDTGQHLDNRM